MIDDIRKPEPGETPLSWTEREVLRDVMRSESTPSPRARVFADEVLSDLFDLWAEQESAFQGVAL